MWLRKNAKSTLLTIFKSESLDKFDQTDAFYVIDGGMLLHKVPWPTNNTFSSIAGAYVSFIERNYKGRATVVFDGYSELSTKSSEQDRREQKKGSIDYEFTDSMVPQISQETFLSSKKNKTQFIDLLTEHFTRHNISWTRCGGDADTEIVRTAISKSQSMDNVAIISEDTDVLVILTALAPVAKEISFIKPKKGKTEAKVYTSRSLDHSPIMKSNILFIHAMSGCDTTSAFYGKGKVKLAKLVEKSKDLAQIVSIFKEPNAPLEKLFEVGKKCIGGLYGLKITPPPVSLNGLRFVTFKTKVSKVNQKTQVLLSSLPPTDDAADFHIKRVYLQIQTWLGNKLDPLDWGWKLNGQNNGYIPVYMSQEPLPEDLQKIMFCSCTTRCGNACGCRKAGLHCTVACRNCCGNECDNCDPSGSKSLENVEEDDINDLDFVTEEDVTFPNEMDLNAVTLNDLNMSNVVFDERLVEDDEHLVEENELEDE